MARPRPRVTTPAYADPADVASAAAQWSTAYLECRDTGHLWQYADGVHVARYGYYRVRHICPRCTMARTREMSEQGIVYATSYDYPDGYLLQGLGRIAGDGKGALRVAAVLRNDVDELRGRVTDAHQPRYGATRRAIGGTDS